MMIDYNYKIDSVKFLGAIAVVLIHLTAFIYYEGNANLLNYYSYRYFLDIAVPFYFVCSGYLLSKKITSYMKSYAKKILSLYISFSIFYISVQVLYIIVDRLIENKPFWVSLSNLFKSFRIENLVKGNFAEFHLWFLAALFISVLILMILVHFNINPKIIFLIGFIFYTFSMTGVFDLNSILSNGGFPKGFFYLSMGYYLGQVNFKVKHAFKLFIIFLISYAVYNIIGAAHLNQYLLATATFFLMIYCIQNPGEPTLLSNLGKHSLSIYVLHVLIYETFYKILDYLGVVGFNNNPINILILTLICIFASIALFKPINNIFIKPVNKLIDLIINLEKKSVRE